MRARHPGNNLLQCVCACARAREFIREHCMVLYSMIVVHSQKQMLHHSAVVTTSSSATHACLCFLCCFALPLYSVVLHCVHYWRADQHRLFHLLLCCYIITLRMYIHAQSVNTTVNVRYLALNGTTRPKQYAAAINILPGTMCLLRPYWMSRALL